MPLLTRKSVARITILSIIAGGLGMALDMAVFVFLFETFKMDQYLANAIGISVGTVASFIFNILWIFKVRNRLWWRFFLFYITGIFGIFLSSFILWLGALAALPVLPVKWFSLLFVAAAQFFLNLFGAFGKRQEERTKREVAFLSEEEEKVKQEIALFSKKEDDKKLF